MRSPIEIRPDLSPQAMALRLALTYALVAVLWILLADRFLRSLRLSPDLLVTIGTAEGLGFVIATSAVLYISSRSALTRIRKAQLALHEQERRIRQGYVDVLDAVTGGKLVLVADDEVTAELGRLLVGPCRVDSPSGLSAARATIRDAAGDVLGPEGLADALSASGEAMDNALKYGGSGSFEVRLRGERIQVLVYDHGPGIDFRLLPKATLVPGFSTGQTLGMGFTIMLQLCERVLICTSAGSTMILLEVAPRTEADADAASAPAGVGAGRTEA